MLRLSSTDDQILCEWGTLVAWLIWLIAGGPAHANMLTTSEPTTLLLLLSHQDKQLFHTGNDVKYVGKPGLKLGHTFDVAIITLR